MARTPRRTPGPGLAPRQRIRRPRTRPSWYRTSSPLTVTCSGATSTAVPSEGARYADRPTGRTGVPGRREGAEESGGRYWRTADRGPRVLAEGQRPGAGRGGLRPTAG